MDNTLIQGFILGLISGIISSVIVTQTYRIIDKRERRGNYFNLLQTYIFTVSNYLVTDPFKIGNFYDLNEFPRPNKWIHLDRKEITGIIEIYII